MRRFASSMVPLRLASPRLALEMAISKPPRLRGARMAKAVTSTMSPPIQPTSARQRCSGSARSCGRSKSVAPVVVRQESISK